jgi:hypothetical protein
VRKQIRPRAQKLLRALKAHLNNVSRETSWRHRFTMAVHWRGNHLGFLCLLRRLSVNDSLVSAQWNLRFLSLLLFDYLLLGKPPITFCALMASQHSAPIIRPRKRTGENGKPRLPFDLRRPDSPEAARIPAHLPLVLCQNQEFGLRESAGTR